MPSLFVIRGNDQGSKYELNESTIPLGRDASNLIQLHDGEVSRNHAEVRRDGAGYAIFDVGSSNGLYVNGERVDDHPLVSGDRVQLGDTLMLYTGQGDASDEDLAEKIDIISKHASVENSRIVRSIPQDEGSRIFEMDHDPSQSAWLARARSNLRVMYRTALAVSHTLDIDQLLGRIMDLIFEWVEADRGCIMLIDSESGRLVPKARRDRKGIDSEEKIHISQTILDYVFDRNEGVLTTNARDDTRWDEAASIVEHGIREAICVPMQGRYDNVGAIYIDTSTPAGRLIREAGQRHFSEDHLKLMIAIAHQAALAIEDTRYYSAMVQAERLAAVGQTIATLSHHIKNILQGIRGGSFLIEHGLAEHDEPMVGKGWAIVDKNQEKISNLVLDMLSFSKEREPELDAADVNRTVVDVIELAQGWADDQNVTLDTQLEGDVPLLEFDTEGFHRAVLNVVTNAIDACEKVERGRVQVSTAYDRAAGLARIVVEDNGRGIAAEDLDKIFTVFVSDKGARGTGLGLSVSHKIIKEHGGRILVDSKLGSGSRFTLEFPAVLAAAEPDPQRPANRGP